MFIHARCAIAMLCMAATTTAASAQSSRRVQATPNTVRYSDTGAKPATGRSGSASLEARVLLGKGGTMLIEASTGSVDDATGPGAIVKTQIKIGGVTRNFNSINGGGFWSSTFPAVSRHTPVQVQANVRGIDAKRTDIVTVTAPALLRPDLSVWQVTGPQTQSPHIPVTFVATVAERNGDAGARANCVLSVDGTEVDEAAGIWVDAAGTVACQFSYTFGAPGTYVVSVAATDTAPGDWDTANNAASTTITIVEPGRTIQNGVLQVIGRRYFSSYFDQGVVDDCRDTWTCVYRFESEHADYLSVVHLDGWNIGLTGSPLARVDAEVYAGGIVQHASSLEPHTGFVEDDGEYVSHCREFYDDVYDGTRWVLSADRFSMCSSGARTNPDWGGTTYWYQFATGDVVYYGAEKYCYTWGCNTYTWQQNGLRYGNGADLGWTAGTDVRLKLAFVDETGAKHTLDKTATLEGDPPIESQDSQTWWDGYWNRTSFSRTFAQYVRTTLVWIQ